MNAEHEAFGGMTSSEAMILLGGLFLLGLLTDLLGRRTILPRAALLLLLGFVLGPSGVGCIDGIGARELGGALPLTRLSLRRVGESGRIPPDPDTAEPSTEDRPACGS